MSPTPIQQLADLGQSIWLDYINRSLLERRGEVTSPLQKLIDSGLRGMTSNPSIFNQVISSSHDYDEKILKFKEAKKSTFEIYDELTITDIQAACDQFQGVYKQTKSLDGYVSLEINPQLANQVEEQIKEGVRLYHKVNRPNVMIKVPSTKQGFPVIEELIAQGINVNVTLIFSLKQYVQTAEAYMKGLKRLSKKTSDLSGVRSVASVFISRVDTMIDKIIDEKLTQEKNKLNKEKLESLKGKAAVANSRIIFEKYKELFSSDEFKALEKQKAHAQRVLWGSTSTKNPKYSDVKYVAELIANPTVNTVPEETLNAFLDHGVAKEAFHYPAKDSEKTLRSLKNFGIDINLVCAKLLDDGVAAFVKSFDSLLESIEKKAAELCVK